MNNFETHLGIIVGSHLNDAMIEVSVNPQLAKKRLKFVKALTFFNEDLTKGVTDEYCSWLWDELFENQRFFAGSDRLFPIPALSDPNR